MIEPTESIRAVQRRQAGHRRSTQLKLRGGGRVVDWGDKLYATTSSTEEIQAMVELAMSKGWPSVEPHGSEKFKQAAWLAARRAGLSVRNYAPPLELEAQFQAMQHQQERGRKMNEISNVMDAATKPTAPPNRWMVPMNQARSRLQEQLNTLRERFNHLTQTDLKARARELTEQYADDGYRDALGRYQATKQAVQNANVLTRKRLQLKQAEARKLLEKEHARLMTTPAITQALAIAKQDNDERAKLIPEIQRLHDSIQFIKVQLRDLESGRDPEIEFRQAWERRKLQPLSSTTQDNCGVKQPEDFQRKWPCAADDTACAKAELDRALQAHNCRMEQLRPPLLPVPIKY